MAKSNAVEQLFLMQQESFDKDCLNDKIYVSKSDENKECYSNLNKVLTDDEQVTLLEKCINADDELNDLANYYYFKSGFKLACKLIVETTITDNELARKLYKLFA